MKPKGQVLWEKYQNFIKKIKEGSDRFPKKAVEFILGNDSLQPKDVNELMVLISQLLVPYFHKEESENPAHLDFDMLESQIYLNLTEAQKKDFEEIKGNKEFVDLCKLYALGLTHIFSLI